MSADLEGRVALVTGAARNIGRAIAMALASRGADVVIHAGRTVSAAQDCQNAVSKTGVRAALVSGDLSDPDEAKRVTAEAVGAFGRLDIVVNNAAIRPENALEYITPDEWRRVMATNVDSAFFVSQAAIGALRKSDQAAIVTIGGMTGHTGAAHRAHVVTSKAAMVGLTKAMAVELAGDGITVNCVVPGLIATDRSHARGGEPHHRKTRTSLIGRRGEAVEVAEAVAHLCGPGARYVTGTCAHVNGGTFLP